MKKLESGMGLIELMLVVAILGLMAVILSDSYRAWAERYRVETEVKEFYADLMDARARAMHKNRSHFVGLSGTGTEYTRYVVYEDTSPGPDGNGVLESTADTKVRDTRPRYAVTTSPAGTTQILINRDGTLDADTVTIRVSPPDIVRADYDCIVLRPTRIKMGRYDGAACVER